MDSAYPSAAGLTISKLKASLCSPLPLTPQNLTGEPDPNNPTLPTSNLPPSATSNKSLAPSTPHNITDVLYMSAVTNARTDASHIEHYNTIVGAQNLVDALDSQILGNTTPKKLANRSTLKYIIGSSENAGAGPHLILSSHTREDKRKRDERFQISKELVNHRLEVEGMIGNVEERRLPMNPLHERAHKQKEKEKEEEKEALRLKQSLANNPSANNDSDTASVDSVDSQTPKSPPLEETFWTTDKPTPSAESAPILPRPIKPLWAPSTYLNPTPVPFSPLLDNKSSTYALNGELIKAQESLRVHLRKTYSGAKGKVFNTKVQKAMEGRYGNYPLATRDRMDELRAEQARHAYALKRKYGDKWPLDPVHGSAPPLGHARVRKLWRRGFIYAKTIAALRTKPPKQATRVELDKLLQIALSATRKKIYYEWEMILRTFHIDCAKEKKRQRRLSMGIQNKSLIAPTGKDIKMSALCYTLRSQEGPKCTVVEVLKLFAHQLGPMMPEVPNRPMDEDAAGKIVNYCEAEEKVPLSGLDDPNISYQVFYDAVYPGEEERAEWDDQLAEKIRLEREEQQKDERVRKLYQQKMEAARSKALADVQDAWDKTFHEIFMNMVPTIVNMRQQDPAYAKATFKVGFGAKITEGHRKTLYHIMTAGMDDTESQNSVRRRLNAEHFAKNGGVVPHVPLNPLRDCMVNCIQYGRGLDGLRPKEACELILEYLATRTQASFRGLKKRRVIQRAMRMWKNKEAAFKSIYYASWAKWALNRVAIRRYCWRPLREWNKISKGIKQKQHTYTVCFWPFYIWRRWATRKVIARKKAKLLKRIWPSYWKIRHFSAWRRWAVKEVHAQKVSTAMRMKLMKKLLVKICKSWHRYAQRRAGIRLSWDRRGHRMMMDKRLELTYRCLNVWRFFRYCSQQMAKRTPMYFRDFILDEEDRHRHATKKAEDAKVVASLPRSHVEHTNNSEFDDKPRESEKKKKGKKGKGKKGKKGGKHHKGKKEDEEEEEEEEEEEAKPKPKAPMTIGRMGKMDSSPAFLSEGVANFKAEAQHRASLAGKIKPPTPGYVAPIGDPFHGTKYSTNPSSLTPRTPRFPNITDTPWAMLLPPDMVNITRGCYERFVLKDRHEMKIAYVMYHRTVPRALQFLYNHVVLNKKDRWVIYQYKLKMKRHYLREWKRLVKFKVELRERGDADAFYGGPSLTSSFDIAPSIAADRSNFEDSISGSAITRDQLEYDRDTRNTQLDATYDQVAKLKTYVNEKQKGLVTWEENQALKAILSERKDAHLKLLMETVNKKTKVADDTAQGYVAEFQMHAARKLFEVAGRIREEVDRFHGINIKWRYLRRIRLILMYKKVNSLYARQKLRNWLRLAVKWRKVEQGMVTYKKIKDMWMVFNQWLKFMEKCYTLRTPGVGKEATRMKKRVGTYVEFLKGHKLLPKAIPYQLMNQIYAKGTEAMFKRWFYFVQMRKGMWKVEQECVRRYELRFQRRVFGFWKTGVNISETYLKRWEDPPYLEGRCTTDLECLRSRFISTYRGNLDILILRENLKKAKEVREEARNGPSFKKFIHGLRKTVQGRVQLEQRMLIEAFGMRGRLEYSDVISDDVAGKGGQKLQSEHGSLREDSKSRVSKALSKATKGTEGGTTVVTAPPPMEAGIKRFEDKPIPAGFGIGEVIVVMKQGGGIVGLMSTAKVEGKEREMGKWGVCSLGMQERFVLKPEEQLLSITVSYGGTVLERIKFTTSSGRSSPWIGQKISPTPHTKKLQAQDADLEDVLYPEDKYIVGFWGYSSRLRIVGLGIISRVVIKQYVFSYYWIKDDTSSEEGVGKNFNARNTLAMSQTMSKREKEHEEELRLKRMEEQRLKEKETEDMAALEFSYLVRMRRSNVNSALERSETFARQLWTSRAIQMNWKLNVFAKYRIVNKLTQWFFEAVAYRLCQLPITDGLAEELIFSGEAIKQDGVRLVEQGIQLRSRVDQDAVRERKWKVTGIVSPKDKQLEKEYKIKLDEGWAKAEEMIKEGEELQVKGEEKVGEGKGMMPAIENSPGVMKYYAKMIEVARREIQLENDFGRDYFASVIRGVDGGGGGGKKGKGFPVDDSSFNSMVGSIKVAQERHHEQMRLYRQTLNAGTLGKGGVSAAVLGAEFGGGEGLDVDMMSTLELSQYSSMGGFNQEGLRPGGGTMKRNNISLAMSKLEASKKRALLDLPPGYVVDDAEHLANASSVGMKLQVEARKVRVGTVTLPEISKRVKSKDESKMMLMKTLSRIRLKEKARIKHVKRFGGGGMRPMTSPGLVENVEGTVPFKRLSTPPGIGGGDKGEGEDERFDDQYFDDADGYYDEGDFEYIEHVPTAQERNYLKERKIADPSIGQEERSFLLNQRINNLPYKDWTGQGGRSSKDEYEMPYVGREEKKGEVDEFEDDFAFLAD